ncbi:MAG: phenylacetate--CoA ligase family protein, partial [Candidatus Riflebacteria bacterium]|nr:phenylacetate--CoA ligase family protein [Candidatus Riflebacteria bacterium]
VVCEPSWLVLLTELAQKKGFWPLKFFLVGGENMTEQARRLVEKAWNCDVFLAYGMTETFGSLGLECPVKRGYHVDEFHNWYEIYKPDQDGYGELVITNLQRNVMPLIRYRSADVTRLIDQPCTCPMPNIRRIGKILGRADELINCVMGNISPPIFEYAFEGIPSITNDWQVGILREEPLDLIEFRLELQEGAEPAATEQAVVTQFRDRYPDFARNIDMGLYKLGVKLHPKGTLRTRQKLKKVVDERKALWEGKM